MLYFWKPNITINAASRKLIIIICFNETDDFLKTLSYFKIKFKQQDLIWILEIIFLENISAKQ